MSRLAVLKAAFSNKKVDNKLSIHNFNEFSKILPRKKIIWPYFYFNHNLISGGNKLGHHKEELLSFYDDIMKSLGIDECVVHICCYTAEEVELYGKLLDECISEGSVRLFEDSNISDEFKDCYTICRYIVYVQSRSSFTVLKQCEYVKYDLCFDARKLSLHNTDNSKLSGNVEESSDLFIITRENKMKINGSYHVNRFGILSNQLHGVDNTGNICVWAAENIMLYLFLCNQSFKILLDDNPAVLEIGGGMTGLVSLGLAAQGKCSRIRVTDGHPDCVTNQRACLHMNRQIGSIRTNFDIEAHRLRWVVDDEFGEIRSLTQEQTLLYDLIIGCDCLFFKDFHYNLIHTISSCLSAKGKAILLQPPRQGTMELFLQRLLELSHLGLEVFQLTEDFDDQISSMRTQYQQAYKEASRSLQSSTALAEAYYDDDIHYPRLIILCKIQK